MPFARLALVAVETYRRTLAPSAQADLLDLCESVAQQRGHRTVEFIDVDAAIRRFQRQALSPA